MLTPYAVYLGVGDCLVPSALERRAQFLDSPPGCGAFHGLGDPVFLEPKSGAVQVRVAGFYGQPGARATRHRAKEHLPSRRNNMSLAALLRPGSPRHEDFMPIYRAMTGSAG